MADDDELRSAAKQRLEDKRAFTADLVAYVVINTALIVIWAVSGAGYFWPIWVLAGWGIGLVLHAWDTFFRQPITETDIQHEMDRQRRLQ